MKPRARAKAKCKSSAAAKAKARATAKAKSAARRSAKAEEKERKEKETKRRAKRTCEVRPSSISAASSADNPEIEEGQGASAPVHCAPTEHVADSKRQRTSKASTISTDKAEGNMADKDQEMENAGTEQEVEKADNDPEKGKSRVSDKIKAEGTFARRYVPDSEVKATKYRAIRDVFLLKLAPCLKGQSKFQDTVLVDSLTDLQKKNLVFCGNKEKRDKCKHGNPV